MSQNWGITQSSSDFRREEERVRSYHRRFEGSPYSDMFGAYAGPGSNWRNLSTPPASDHFHSPLPGMTHPMWPCPPTPLPCSDGCSMSYYNPPSLYSAYSAYISSLMSGSAASEYPPYLSPRLPGPPPPPPPIPSYQQRLHDMHKAYLLSNSAGGHARSEFSSPWNPYVTGPSAGAPPLPSRGYISSVGQVGVGFSGDTSSTSSSRCISVEEQKQIIKQEPLPNKIKTKDVPADHKPRDATRRDQHRPCERSSISRQEPMSESKTVLVTKKLMKDEKQPSPVAGECSLDLCNNNININKMQHNVYGSNESVRPNLQSTSSIRSNETTTENSVHSVDFKPHLKTLHSPDRSSNAEDGRSSQLSQVSSCRKKASIGIPKVTHQVQMTPEPSSSSSLCNELHEKKTADDEFPLSTRSGQNWSGNGSSTSTSKSHADKEELVRHSSLSVDDLTGSSRMEVELRSRKVSADVIPAVGSSTSPSVSISPLLQMVAGNSLHDGESNDASSSANRSDKSPEGTSHIIQHSVYFEEISNDGIETDEKTDAEGECDQVDEPTGFRYDATISNIVPLSKMSDHSSDSSQQASFSTKTDSDHLGSPLPVPLSLASSASAALSHVSMSSSLLSSVSFASVSMSSSSTDVSVFSGASLKVPSLGKNDAQTIPLQPVALTLYVDSSVKPPKTSVSDGVNCGSGQEIDLAMPHQSMRYQVSHQRHHPMQDGCKVHAPTFLPEVCTLLSNAVTTITVSSSGGCPSSLRPASSGRNGTNITVPSKSLTGQQRLGGRSLIKPRNCAGHTIADVLIKTEKEMKVSGDSGSTGECKEIGSPGKGQSSGLLVSAAPISSGRTHILDRDALDSASSQPLVQMDVSISKTWSQSVVGGSSLFSNVLSPNYFSRLSSSAAQHPTIDRRQSSNCSSSQFTITHMSLPSAVASASSQCTSVGHQSGGRALPATGPSTSLGVVEAPFTGRNVDKPPLVMSIRSPDTLISSVSQWDESSIPENLSTKTALSEREAEVTMSESTKRPSVKPALLSSLIRDGLPVSRHTANSQVDGSSGNNIPVGIARALQRTIPQPAPACSSEDAANISPDISLTLDRQPTTEGKLDNISSIGILSSDDCTGEKIGLLCVGSSQAVEPESAGPGSASTSDKQPCWKNDLEARPPLLPASFNHPWIAPGAQPTTHPAPINPAAALWMGQFPFHPGALLPYSTGSVDRSQSQHLFHPSSGYKLAQDSITGQFFFIPVPGMTWPSLGSRHIFQDPIMPPSHKEKELTCATRAADDSSPSLSNCAASEDVRADVTSSAAEAGHLSNKVSTSQQSDLSSNCLPLKIDHHSLTEGTVDISPLGQYPIVYPAARPPYFFCDSNLFVHEANKQKEKTRISVESRGTSPIQQHPELDLLRCSESKNPVEEKERVTGAKGGADREKTTLNASVQTNQSASLPQSPEKAFTAEISIQTSDISDSDSDDSLSIRRQKPKFFKFKKQASLPNRTVKLTDSNKYCEEVDRSCRTMTYGGLLTSTTRDPALSDISSDEAEYDSRVILSSQGLLTNCLFNKKEALEPQETEVTACLLGQSSPKTRCSSLIAQPEQLSQVDVTGTGISDLIEAATTEFANSCGKGSRPNVETFLTSLSSESGVVNQELDGLVMLSTIASNHTPAVVLEIPQKASDIIESSNGSPVRRFNIFDLPISQLIEAERSPDVSTSYNIPKSCFFDQKEFTLDSTDYPRYQNSSEPSAEDLKSGILKSDEGPENMDPVELDLRMKMAEVQMKYKQEQKELARLQRKSSESRNSGNQKRKKSKPVLKPNVQKKASTSKQASVSSDTSSSESSSDDEEPIQKFSKKNSKPKSEVKFTASLHAVSNLTEDVNGIKIKVSNPQRRTSSASMSSSSSQFQKSASSKKEHRLSKDSSDSGKDSLTLKQLVQVNMAENHGKSNPVLNKMKSACDTTEDMPLKKKPKQFCFYSYKKNKSSSATLNSLGKDIKKHKFRTTESKNSNNQKHLIKAEMEESQKTVDDEWYRRRSERIFLHEASVGSVSSPPGTASSQISGLDDRSLPSSPTKTVSKPRSLSQDVAPKNLTSNLKSELSVTVKSCTPNVSDILSTKKSLVSSDSSGSDSNTQSDSDTDDAPLSTLVQKECTTAPKSSTIDKDDLVDGLRVLYLKDELFYEGTVKAIQPPDVYRISIDGERSSRQEIVSQEQLLERAILNVRPSSKDQLSEGSRICAYWSQKFSCLYPGTVKIRSDDFESDDDETLVNVEFDDGDTGKIPLAHISMLPAGYQIQESHHPPMMLVSRKRRNTVDEPAADQLQHPSLVSRSMSAGDSSAKHHSSDRPSQASGDVCSSGVKQSSSGKPKSNGKSETCSAAAQEQKGKKETQEYSCRLKTEGSTDKPLAGFGVGLIGKKSSQKVDAVENCEKGSSRDADAYADAQKKTHLTLTIKRKQSIERETSSGVDEDEENDSSSDDEMPKSHRYHTGRKRGMKLDRIDSRSDSDSDEEIITTEAAKRKGQKRKKKSSLKSPKSKKRHHSSSSESGDQIGAFRPVWEQWQWYGPCTRRPGMKGRAKKQFYRAIQRGNEILKLGEAAVFVSMGHNDLQYVGRIDSLWESWDGNMVVKVKWYYHPEETKGGKRLLEMKSALYQSSHEDENDVQTVSHKCEVLSYTNYKRFQAKKYHVECRPEDVFYLAGTYDPTISMITFEHDVPLNSH